MGSVFSAMFSYLMQSEILWIPKGNKVENVHRFALSALRGEFIEEKREREFWDIIHGLPIFHSKD